MYYVLLGETVGETRELSNRRRECHTLCITTHKEKTISSRRNDEMNDDDDEEEIFGNGR